MSTPETELLDSAAFAKVEGMHRGNLYQHLYVVGCALLAQRAGVTLLRIELDEDVELQFADLVRYVQIKTRASSLTPSAVETSLERFKQLESAHANNSRTGKADFFVVSNQPPGPTLRTLSEGRAWKLLYPGSEEKTPAGLPAAWPTITAGFEWCRLHAAELPLRTLPADALVWKLAAQIQAISAGELSLSAGSHRLGLDDIAQLFEQAAFQLHAFPPAPTPFRDYESAPTIDDQPVTLVVGLSGSGKTTWAAEQAQHTAEPTAYFDAAAIGPEEYLPALARELVAQLLGDGAAAELRAARSSLEMLCAVASLVKQRGVAPYVFLDNVHKVRAETLASVTRNCAGIRWVLLAQPSPELPLLESTLMVTATRLQGWTLSSVAAELRTAGATASVSDAKAVIDLTGGLPMFVRGLAGLASREYQGQTGAACQAVRARTTTSDLPQDIITAATFSSLSQTAQLILSLLLTTEAALPAKWIIDAVGVACKCSVATVAGGIRELNRFGAIQQSVGGEVWGHSSFLGVANDWALNNVEALLDARKRLTELLRADGLESRLSRLKLLLRLLADTAQYAELAALVTSSPERIHEYGLSASVMSAMTNALREHLSVDDRFWILDALAFWHFSNEDWVSGKGFVDQMEPLLKELESPRAKASFHQKRLHLAAEAGDVEGVKIHFNAAKPHVASDLLGQRILRHNYASILSRLGEHKEAEREAAALCNIYYKLIGISADDLFAKNIPDIAKLLSERRADPDEVKRLADELFLYFQARNERGVASTREIINSHKLYAVTGHMTSAVRAGQEAADQALTLTADPTIARRILESVLSMVHAYGLLDYIVPVRAQQAVVYAYCGEPDLARATMKELAAFVPDLSPSRQAEIANQTAIIERIARGELPLKRQASLQDSIRLLVTKKPERNEPCPCGSGLKYKKCHG